MIQADISEKHNLHELGYKIFLDRYAQKDMSRTTLAVGDTVIVLMDSQVEQREIGEIVAMDLPHVTVRLSNNETVVRPVEHIDKPLETNPAQMMDRVAAGVAASEKTSALRQEWTEKFRWALDDWKFVPGGRILVGAGTDQDLTFFNCYVLPCARDSREGIIERLGQMTEIMSRGGGVGINLSSLRPRHSYVKGVNGRSSGSVSWGALYSFATGLIEQGGCLTPDTLIFTEDGTLRLDEIVQHTDKGWREQSLTVMTDQGKRQSRQAYNNGIAEVLAVNTDMGLNITGTPNHKVKIMTDTGPQWQRLDELQCGDSIMVKLNQHKGRFQALCQPEYKHHNQKKVSFPKILDEELAFFLGYFMGDGFMASREDDWRVGVSVAHSSYLMDEMPRLLRRLFDGANVRKQQKDDDASVTFVISNRSIKEFLKMNGFDKPKSADVYVPALIRRSPREVVGAFLRGLFEADGGLSHGYPSLISTSKRLIDEATILLIGLGCPVRTEQMTISKDRYGTKPMWRLRVHSFRGLQAWRDNIGCDPASRFAACFLFEPDLSREVSYVLPHSEYWVEPVLSATVLPSLNGEVSETRPRSTDPKLRKKLLRYTRGDRNLTLSAYTTLAQTHEDFTEYAIPVNDMWFVSVDSVRSVGEAPTLDIEVDDNHTYIANGLVTHNSRRGALMLILNDWHPDVLEFINSKRRNGYITNANISVGLSDKFMEAVKNDDDWDLLFPDTSAADYNQVWDGDLEGWVESGHKVIHHKTIKARELWNAVIESAWASAEPGLWFRERANKMSNSYYYSSLISTNPCGEVPLPGFSVCNLGSINLSKFYDSDKGDVAWDKLQQTVRYAVRFLDNIIDITPYFFDENKSVQRDERRVGMGTMGIAELMVRLGIRYGSDESVVFIDKLCEFVATNAYQASIELSEEKGAFPQFDAEKFLQSGFMQNMPEVVRDGVQAHGIRNVTLLTQAPTGSTGTMVNTSTGIEPFFSWSYYRKGRLGLHEERVEIVKEWFEAHPDEKELPDYFVTAMELSPENHVRVQAAIQRWVDSSISKTCNVPNDYTVDQTRELYEYMYKLGCKGGTIYRDGSRDEQVLTQKDEPLPEEQTADVIKQVATPHHVYPRPPKLQGVTVKCATPFGKAYVGMNSDDNGYPFEVFITAPGKAGSDLQADAEGLGRMISLALRSTEPHNRLKMVRLIIDQLRGIGGARSVGFGQNRVTSLPDSVSHALEENYFPKEDPKQLDLPMVSAINGSNPNRSLAANVSNDGVISGADMCPSCAMISLIRTEGCRTCLSCGYSEC